MRDHDQNEEPEALLRDASGNPVPLQGVAVRGRLSGTLASVEVEQRYRNPLDHNIEAVYTFPLPMGAVLLEMVVEVDGRTLAGQVVERKTAERRYEDAITDGDTAVMVQDNGDGLFTMNFGNLMAGEEAAHPLPLCDDPGLAWRPPSLPCADHHRTALRRPAGRRAAPLGSAGIRSDGRVSIRAEHRRRGQSCRLRAGLADAPG